jgi:hypothetical protein
MKSSLLAVWYINLLMLSAYSWQRNRVLKSMGPNLISRVISTVGSTLRLKQSIKIKINFIEIDNYMLILGLKQFLKSKLVSKLDNSSDSVGKWETAGYQACFCHKKRRKEMTVGKWWYYWLGIYRCDYIFGSKIL